MASGNIARGFRWLVNATGALLGFVSGDGSDVMLWDKGAHADRPAVSVFNIGMTWLSEDLDAGTLFHNFTGVSWTQIATGLNYGTGVELYLRDTYANIDLVTGDHVGQRAFCSDYGTGRGAQREWNGSAWVWPPIMQLLKVQHAAATAPLDTAENTLFTYTLPAMGANDQLRFDYMFTITSSANSKTLKIKLDATSGISNAYTNTAATVNGVINIRNRNATNAQAWFSSGKTVYGDATQALTTSTKQLGTAGVVFAATATKVTGAEAAVLEFGDLWICGGA